MGWSGRRLPQRDAPKKWRLPAALRQCPRFLIALGANRSGLAQLPFYEEANFIWALATLYFLRDHRRDFPTSWHDFDVRTMRQAGWQTTLATSSAPSSAVSRHFTGFVSRFLPHSKFFCETAPDQNAPTPRWSILAISRDAFHRSF